MKLDFELIKSMTGGQPVIDVACPACGPSCRAAANRNRKVLRLWDEGDFVSYKCVRCDGSGWARGNAGSNNAARRPQPKPQKDKTDLANFLWSVSVPMKGTAAEAYLRARGCFLPSDNLRALQERGEYPPAMIARMGPTGVHLTKLRADGAGKAGTDADKLIIGPSLGEPIVVANNPEREELIVTEGIEDALSLAIVTGWSVWAAGTANRIPRVLSNASSFPKVYCAVDLDFGKKIRAGPRAFSQARAVREDVVPLHIERVLGVGVDANKGLLRYGRDALLTAIEWSEWQNDYALGKISFGLLQIRLLDLRLPDHDEILDQRRRGFRGL